MKMMSTSACGILFCYNEEQILGETIRHYLGQGIDLVVFDNCSADDSVRIARRFQEQGGYPGRLLEIVSVKTDGYEWGKILRTACDFMHARLSHYDWLMTIDADSFYFSPVRGMGLKRFIGCCSRAGYNIIGGNLYEFYPTEKDNPAIATAVDRMRYCKVMPWEEKVIQQKVFRYDRSVDFYSQFGHRIVRQAPRPAPVRFIYNHYPWTSYEHGLKKIFRDRKPRYVERRQNPVNHMHYLDMLPEKMDLVKRSADLHFFRLDELQMAPLALIKALAADRGGPAGRKAARTAADATAMTARFARSFKSDPVAALTRAAGKAAARAGIGRAAPTGAAAANLEPAPEKPANSGLPAGDGVSGRPELPAATLPGAAGPAAGEPCLTAAAAADPVNPEAAAPPPARPEPPRSDLIIRCDEIHTQGARVTGFPETYHFLLTNFCNARCLFCNQKIVADGHRQLTLDDFRRLTANIPVESTRVFYLSGGGDPLLARDLAPIIGYINSEFPWIEVRLRTNGLLLGRLAAELARTDIRLELSVHGATAKTNGRILRVRNGGAVFTGIRELNKELEAGGGRMRKLLVPAVSRLNIEEMPALIKKASGLGIDEIEIYFTRFYGDPEGAGAAGAKSGAGGAKAVAGAAGALLDPGQSLYYHQELYGRIVTECCELAASLGIVFRWEALFGDGPRAGMCYDPWRNVVVDWEGDVFPCCGGEVWFHDRVKSGEYRFGNLFEEELYRLLDNETYVKIRRTLSPAYTDDLIPECGYCHNSMTFTGPDDRGGHIISPGRATARPRR